ncbi:peroxisomal membrane protein 13-like isoform X2 [Phoenix dactylifera]|uniref:Peroxin-13 n=1 Tax=Phoenix dactylifera TaxID=42345 RepID=A0A8B9AWX4_PHODC|nr:peroxisomal membrane protein 13-like isoform X2 [Phoenix dactylifera]
MLQEFGNTPPPKPWDRAGTSPGPSPFKPQSSGGTSDVVEASGTAKPGEIVPNNERNALNNNIVGRPLPPRPWQQNHGTSYGGYGSDINYNSGYGSGIYSSYGGLGGYGGTYSNNMSSGYGGLYGNSGMYPGSMYNSGFGGSIGGYGMGMGSPYGTPDTSNPYGPPSSPPAFWISFVRSMQGVINFFGRITILIVQNTQAFHMFMSALLQLFDRSGLLYGELARFVLRLLGIKTRPRKHPQLVPGASAGPDGNGQQYVEGPKAATGSWDNAWGGDVKKASCDAVS